jgi:hypothetical protein
LKFNIVTEKNSQDVHRKISSLIAKLKTFVTHFNGKAAHLRTAQSLAFATSFLTHILNSLTPTF